MQPRPAVWYGAVAENPGNRKVLAGLVPVPSVSPLWVGGGTVFGPAPRSHAKDMPRKARRLAIRCALSAKVAEGALVVVDNLTFDAPKTKDAVALLNGLRSCRQKSPDHH